jgi:hypothetical protein
VPYFDESLAGLAAHALGWRIGSEESWVLSFQILQLPHQLVVVEVADFGIVEDIIEILVVANFLAERFDLLFDVFFGWHRRRIILPEKDREKAASRGEPREILRSA